MELVSIFEGTNESSRSQYESRYVMSSFYGETSKIHGWGHCFFLLQHICFHVESTVPGPCLAVQAT